MQGAENPIPRQAIQLDLPLPGPGGGGRSFTQRLRADRCSPFPSEFQPESGPSGQRRTSPLAVLGQLVAVLCQHGAHHLSQFPAGLDHAGADDFELPDARFPVHRQCGG